jgi:myo-inositol-1(or 4)-monophosphatase
MHETLIKALHTASEILLENYGKTDSYSVKESQSSIVTMADIASEKKIMEIIASDFPMHNTLGEETGFINLDSAYTWIVDPLDGTSNFTAGVPWFGVIICILEQFKPVMAGCMLPATGDIYFASAGNGATLNGMPIHVSLETELKNVLAAYSLDFSDEPGKTDRESQIIKKLVSNVRNLRATNCLVDMCYVADGRFGACANQTTRIWDIAGPGLIITEAGGTVTDISGQLPDYSINSENYDRNFTFAASSSKLHQQFIQVIS